MQGQYLLASSNAAEAYATLHWRLLDEDDNDVIDSIGIAASVPEYHVNVKKPKKIFFGAG